MRYSFIIPYYKRAREFWHTLLSFRHHYGKRNDIEIIVVEDGANFENDDDHQGLIDVLYAFGDLNWVHLVSEHKNQYNPVLHRNQAAEVAKGIILVNTNPECWHRTDILREMDKYLVAATIKTRYLPEGFGPGHPQWKVPSFRQKYEMAAKQSTLKDYIVCACDACYVDIDKPAEFDFMMKSQKHWQWYQHSEKNNRMLHWCSAISKENYAKIGGFDEKFAAFCGYDDDDFREKIKAAGIPIVVRDDMIVVHTVHDCTHQSNTKDLSDKGLAYFNSKWPEYGARPFK